MHPTATRNEFLRLRVQGLSLARIGRRLGVSKPTLIAWSRQAHVDLASGTQVEQQRVQHELSKAASDELAALNRRLTALKQELFSRAMREFPTSALEIFLGEIRQRIEQLSGTCPAAPLGAQALACSNSVQPPERPAQPGSTAPPAAASENATALPGSVAPSPAPSLEVTQEESL